MKILVVNVNTTESMTGEICAVARSSAGPSTEIVGLTPFFGPSSVEGHIDGLISGAAVVDRVAAVDYPFDGVIVAGFGDLGREGLQEMLTVPVVDITEAAVVFARMLGDKYSVVTMHRRSIPIVESRLRSIGMLDRCASVRATGLPVLALDGNGRGEADSALAAEARSAVEDDGAESIVLGCAGMAGLRERVQDEVGVPVVDGVEAAVHALESLVRMSLFTSKVGAFAPPNPKAFLTPPGMPTRPYEFTPAPAH